MDEEKILEEKLRQMSLRDSNYSGSSSRFADSKDQGFNSKFEEYSVTPFGMSNTGSICYFTSIMQALLSCPSLSEYIMKNKDKISKSKLGGVYITCLDSAIKRNNPSDMAARCLNEMKADLQKQKMFEYFGSRQEDADEGLNLILDVFDEPDVFKLFNHKYDEFIFCRYCDKNITKEPRAVINSRYLWHSFDMDIKHKYEFILKISKYNELLETYKCTECNRLGLCYRRGMIKTIPEILVVTLNKYINNNSPKWAPEIITFPSSQNRYINYRIVSLVDYSGNGQSGHYSCRCRRADGEVYKFNDSSVQKSDLNVTPTTYMIFYHFMCYSNDPM